MKKYLFSILCLAFLFTTACEENMPVIDCLSCETNTGGPVPPQDRKVMIEEFTGVRCINCPAGSAEIETLLAIHGERLIAVSIHAEFFATPYNDNQYDFRTDEGEFIISLLGLPEAYPSAVIDRRKFTGESDLQLVGKELWAGRIAEELDRSPQVSLAVENDYNESNRSLSVRVTGGAFETLNDEVRLTIMVTENGVKDAQLTPDSSPDLDLEYSHKHVLRKVLTAFDGDVLASSLALNETFDETYQFTLPDAWVAENCEVIAFAHLNGDVKDILQAAEAHVVE